MSAPSNWGENRSLLPPFEATVKALQDEGKEKKGKRGRLVMKHPKLSRFAQDVCSNLTKQHPKCDGLDSNISRGKEDLINALILQRKHVDVSSTHVAYHPVDCKVFCIVPTDVDTGGLGRILQNFQHFVMLNIKKYLITGHLMKERD